MELHTRFSVTVPKNISITCTSVHGDMHVHSTKFECSLKECYSFKIRDINQKKGRQNISEGERKSFPSKSQNSTNMNHQKVLDMVIHTLYKKQPFVY